MKEQNYKIIFDVFGVLMSSGFKSAANDLSERLNIPADRIKKYYEKWEPDFDLGKIDSQKFWHNVLDDLNISYPDWKLLDNIVLNNYSLKQDTYNLCEKLSKITDVYLLSNTRQEWFELLNDKFHITKYAQKAFLSYEIGYLKPDPACFSYVMEQIGCPANELILIDDTLINVESARSLGIHGIQFVNAAQAESELKALI